MREDESHSPISGSPVTKFSVSGQDYIFNRHGTGTLRHFVWISILPRVAQNTSQTPIQTILPSLSNNTSQHMWIVINVPESQNGVKLDWRNISHNKEYSIVLVILLCTSMKIINFGIEKSKSQKLPLNTLGGVVQSPTVHCERTKMCDF